MHLARERIPLKEAIRTDTPARFRVWETRRVLASLSFVKKRAVRRWTENHRSRVTPDRFPNARRHCPINRPLLPPRFRRDYLCMLLIDRER